MSVKWLEIAAGGGADLAAYDGDDGKGGERVSPSADGSAVMEGFPATPLNLVTIWGAARTGKSFFLNALARVDGLFHVSGAMEPCTSGADLSTVLRSVHDLAKYDCATTTASGASSSRSSSLGAPPLVGFVDVEGQGDRHSSYDVLLATPLLLLSKASALKNCPNAVLIEVCRCNIRSTVPVLCCGVFWSASNDISNLEPICVANTTLQSITSFPSERPESQRRRRKSNAL